MSDVVERAEAALEGVSEEPWHIPRRGTGIDSGEYGTVIGGGDVDCMSYCYGGSSTIEGDNLDADLRFIAAARSLLPELVAELKTTRAQRDEFAAQLDDALKDWTEDDEQLLAENQRLAAELKATRAQLAQVNRAFLDNCRICAVGDQDCPCHGESPYQPRRATESVRND